MPVRLDEDETCEPLVPKRSAAATPNPTTTPVLTFPTEWTPDNVFAPDAGADAGELFRQHWPPYMPEHLLSPILWGGGDRMWYSPEYIAALERETGWLIESDGRAWPKDLRRVGAREVACSVCGGREECAMVLRGETTGAPRQYGVPCACVMLHRLHDRWASLVPERFRSCSLATVVPRNEQQAKALALMRKHPTDSFFLYGASRAGKTHLTYALARKIITWEVQAQAGYPLPEGVRPPKVWIARAGVMLDELQEWRSHRWSDDAPGPKLPTVSTGMIQTAVKQGLRPTLILQEIDRWNVTPDRVERMQELLDAMYEANGQIIATSNRGPGELITKWGETEATVGIGRIVEPGTGRAIRFGVNPEPEK